MSGLFWVLALFGLAVALVLGVPWHDGYVLLVMPPWRAEISLALFALALLAGFLVLYVALRVLVLTSGLPALVGRYRSRRRAARAADAFYEALRYLFEGRFGQALTRASDAHEAGGGAGLAALVAARAAQRLREPEKQRTWLARAKADDSRNGTAALMLEAEMMNEEHRFDEALSALDALQQRRGRHIAAMRMEMRARQGTGDWAGVLRIARQMAKREAMAPEVLRELFSQAHAAEIAGRTGDRKVLIAYLRAIPPGERGERVVVTGARALMACGADEEAERLLRAALEATEQEGGAWSPELVDLFGRLTGGDSIGRIARAEHWLPGHTDDAALLLALGRMCARERLWGKAQGYLEASLAVEESQPAHLELATLLDVLEKPDEANRHYRASVRVAPR